MLGAFPSLRKVIIRVLEIAGAGLTSAMVAYVLGRTEPPPPPPAPAVVHLAPADEEMIRTVRSDQAALLDQLRNNADARKTATAPAAPSTQVPPPAAQATANTNPHPAPSVPPLVSVTDVAVSATDLLPATNPPATNPPAANPPSPNSPAAAATPTAPTAAGATVKPPAASAPAKAAKTVAIVRREPKPEHVRLLDSASEAKSEFKPETTKPTRPRGEARLDEASQQRPTGSNAADQALQRPVAPSIANSNLPQATATSVPVEESETGFIPALKGLTGRLLPSRDRLPMPEGGALRPPAPVGEFQQSEASSGMRGASDF